MKATLKKIARGLLLVPALALSLSVLTPAVDTVSAQGTNFNRSIEDGVDAAQGTNQPADLFDGQDSIFRTVVNVLLFVIGAIAVIMLIIGGIRYVVSGGDQNAVTGAKNTILYAVVGIVVAILAYAAVNFVTGAFTA